MMLTGAVPFARTSALDCWMKKIKNDFPPPKKLRAGLSDRVNWAVLRAMSADPAKRPASCREFLEDLTGQTWQGWHSNAASSGEIALGSQPPSSGLSDLWYLMYKTAEGQSHKVKGTTESIRQNVKAGLLGDANTIMICRTKQGPFTPLKAAAEFRDLVVSAATLDTTRASGKQTPIGNDTARIIQTRSIPPKKRSRITDPAVEIETEVHKVKPLRSKTNLRPAPSRLKQIDYSTWLIVALAITTLALGLILFTRGR
jgi:hypothetical protein